MRTPFAPLVTAIINVIPFNLLFSSTNRVKKKNPAIFHKSGNPETFNIKTVTISNMLTTEIEINTSLWLPGLLAGWEERKYT